MRISVGALIIIFSVLLQSCASSIQTQHLQSGKMSFISGDFKTALHELLPLAIEGVPQAQYSVGYMYYYGYGTAQDSETGIAWMKKAAASHDALAVKALAAIEKNAVQQGTR